MNKNSLKFLLISNPSSISIRNFFHKELISRQDQSKQTSNFSRKLHPKKSLIFWTFRDFRSRQNTFGDLGNDKLLNESMDIEAITQKLIKQHNLPSESSSSIRLGILEGYFLNTSRTSNNNKHKVRNDNIFKIVLIGMIVTFFGLTMLLSLPSMSTFIKPNRFKSFDETGSVSEVRFSDIGGVDEAKEELTDVVEFLKDPNKFTQLGAKLPKGILLVGEPGTGKTMLARAVAGEAGVPFFYAAGSEFDETFVGVGASRIRQLFESAREQAPSIIFIDEIDACGSQRSNSPLQPYARQTINQLLQEMDGFRENDTPVIVLGATNTGEALDKALKRPGRFDTEVQVQLPDIKGRKDLFNIYLAKTNTDDKDKLDIDKLSSLTIGMSGADISNLVNQAALQAAKLEKKFITQSDLEFALDKIRMGPESTSRVRTESEIRKTAHHEAGHALVAYYTPAAWSIYKATIRQRGSALGHLSQIPGKEDENSMTKEKVLARLDVAMGGRIAEELLYGEDKVSTGASSDIAQATSLAYKLICEYGMSKKLGLMKYHLDHVSEETKRNVDVEVLQFLASSYERTKDLLKNRSNQHQLLSEALIKYETLTMEEIQLTLETGDLYAVQRLQAQRKVEKEKKEKIEMNSITDNNNTGLNLIPINMVD